MINARYRVVLTGELVSGFSRDAVIASLARLFETSAADVARVFEGGEHAIGDILGAHEASTLQKRLEHIGARARVDRVAAGDPGSGDRGSALRLPRQDDPADAGLMHCPACGHAQLVAKSCDECGVVFAQYNRQRAAASTPPAAAPVRRAPPQQRSVPAQRPAGTPKANDIHTDASVAWREDWLDDNEISTEDYHLKLFMGGRSAQLAEACKKMSLGRRTRLTLSWTGGAVFSPFLWAMYRKMWAWGMLIFVFEILLPVALITLGSKPGISDKLTYLGLGLIVANRVFWPALMKSLYCRHARKTVMYMHRMAPTYASDIDIATRGGTSRTSVFVGVVLAIVVSLLTWSIVDTLHARLMARGPAFSAPVNLPEAAPARPKPADPVAAAQNELLANENRWVSTRNRLRVLGQKISAWLSAGGSSVDPAGLDVAAIALALSLSREDTTDGWDRQIAYSSDGKGYKLSSAGPDGKFGSSDDVEYRRIVER